MLPLVLLYTVIYVLIMWLFVVAAVELLVQIDAFPVGILCFCQNNCVMEKLTENYLFIY